MSQQLSDQALEPHGMFRKIEENRNSARANGTTYLNDFPSLFGRACLDQWKKWFYNVECSSEKEYKAQLDKVFSILSKQQQTAYTSGDYRQFFTEIELVLRDGVLVEVADEDELKSRADNYSNKTGVVAWKLRLYTPEKPKGYDVVLIANDITFQSGSFATHGDEIDQLASEYSRLRKIPRVNVYCNSGARIGLADDVSTIFRAKFKNPENPHEVDGDDEVIIGDQICSERLPNGLLKLTGVIGQKNEQIGVENLQGSGLIAGETSAAYNEVPTYCLVTGRSVGMGAYTARLAHRIVQIKHSHFSNNQLGGIQIMHKNGVTHSVVNDDFEGICKIVQWMGYLPQQTENFPFHEKFGMDQQPRLVDSSIEPNKPYDVRALIDSKHSTMFAGICDGNSFDEIMEEWAKTIVAGRARICGIPIGVVSCELRNVKNVAPDDPAVSNCLSIEIHNDGRVWYPDAEFNTAEVIGDFNREGLPLLFVFPLNGFSESMTGWNAMEIKFGAQIVDALRQYKQPVIIYIPVQGELNSGAWAVLDGNINPGIITTVVDEKSHGGLIGGIDIRQRQILALQKMNDVLMKKWDVALTDEIRQNGPETKEAQRLCRLLKQRSAGIMPTYSRCADQQKRAADQYRKSQHVTDLANCRNLFSQIFSLEIAKIHLAEKYKSMARDVSLNCAYAWLKNRLEEYNPGFTSLRPSEQAKVVDKFFSDGKFAARLEPELVVLDDESDCEIITIDESGDEDMDLH